MILTILEYLFSVLMGFFFCFSEILVDANITVFFVVFLCFFFFFFFFCIVLMLKLCASSNK